MQSNFRMNFIAALWFRPGSPERLLRFRRMVAEGRPVVYGAIGGSITEGAAASSPGSRYVSCIAYAIQNRTACRLVNAGVGATDTRFGAMRCREDLLRYRPDLITIEYAVNDVNNPDRDFSFEALVRQCMVSVPDALIVVIFTLREDGVSMQEIQLPVCRHYDLAMISYHDAIWPELSGGNLAWSAVSPDNIHPNDVGHRLIADLVTRLLFGQPVEAVPLKAPLDPRCAEYEGGPGGAGGGVRGRFSSRLGDRRFGPRLPPLDGLPNRARSLHSHFPARRC